MAIRPLRSRRRRWWHAFDESRQVERRVFVKAPPRTVWTALHSPAGMAALFPELTLGPADRAWPAAAAVRTGRARLGLLRQEATVESLEARPLTSFRFLVSGRFFASEWRFRLEPRAGGTRVVHDAILQPGGRIADWMIRRRRGSLAERVEVHLRALKEIAEAEWIDDADAQQGSRPA